MSEHVGFGRNKGDGGDSENLQKTDELGRYTSDSAKLFDAIFGNGMTLYYETPQWGAMESGPLEGDELKESLDSMKRGMAKAFSQMPPALAEAFSLLDPVGIGADSKGECYYSEDDNMVYMGTDFIKNGGSPYDGIDGLFTHEYAHALDSNVGRMMGFGNKPASLAIPLSDGRTFLQTVEDEFDRGKARELFEVLMSQPYARAMASKTDANRRKMEVVGQMGDVLAGSLEGLLRKDDPEFASKQLALYWIDADNYDKPEEWDDRVRDLYDAFSKTEAFSKMEKLKDIYVKMAEAEKENFAMRTPAKCKEYTKEWGTIADLSRAACSVYEESPYLTYGHNKYYFSNPKSRAMEVFAEVGELIEKGGIAGKWLMENCPATMSAYGELLGIINGFLRKRNAK